MQVFILQAIQYGAQSLAAGVSLDVADDVAQGWLDAGLAQSMADAVQSEPVAEDAAQPERTRARANRASA